MLKLLCKFPAYNDRLRSWFKLKERSARDWKVRSTKVVAGDFKHELLNRLRSTMAANVLIIDACRPDTVRHTDRHRRKYRTIFTPFHCQCVRRQRIASHSSLNVSLLGCDSVFILLPTHRRSSLPPSSAQTTLLWLPWRRWQPALLKHRRWLRISAVSYIRVT